MDPDQQAALDRVKRRYQISCGVTEEKKETKSFQAFKVEPKKENNTGDKSSDTKKEVK